MKDYTVLADIVDVVEFKLQDAYDEGYDKGKEDSIDDMASSFTQGENTAYAEIEEIAEFEQSHNEEFKQFVYDICGVRELSLAYLLNPNHYGCADVIKHFKAWKEEKQSEDIKVGDEVYYDSDRNDLRVVTCIFVDCEGDKWAAQTLPSGRSCCDSVSRLHRTGRHFGEIEKVLKLMKGV